MREFLKRNLGRMGWLVAVLVVISAGAGYADITWGASTASPAYTRIQDANQTYTALVNPTGGLDVQVGGMAIPTKLTATACTAINGTGIVHKMWAAGTETATVSIYDEGASPTCAAADLIWTGTLTATPIVLDYNDTNGIAYKMSGAPAVNDYMTRN